jgi:hypothetical protein
MNGNNLGNLCFSFEGRENKFVYRPGKKNVILHWGMNAGVRMVWVNSISLK